MGAYSSTEARCISSQLQRIVDDRVGCYVVEKKPRNRVLNLANDRSLPRFGSVLDGATGCLRSSKNLGERFLRENVGTNTMDKQEQYDIGGVVFRVIQWL